MILTEPATNKLMFALANGNGVLGIQILLGCAGR